MAAVDGSRGGQGVRNPLFNDGSSSTGRKNKSSDSAGSQKYSQKYQHKTSATPTKGLKTNDARSDKPEKTIEARKAEVSDPKHRKPEKGHASGSSAKTGTIRSSSESGPQVERTHLVRPDQSRKLQGGSSSASQPAPLKAVMSQWDMTAKDRQVIALAEGVRDLQSNWFDGNYQNYLNSVVDFMIAIGNKKEHELEFVKLLFLKEVYSKEVTKDNRIDSRGFRERMALIPADLTSANRSKIIVTLLARLWDKEQILKCFNSRNLSNHERAAIKLIVYENTVDRLVSGLCEYAQHKRDEVLGREPKTQGGSDKSKIKSLMMDFCRIGVIQLDNYQLTKRFYDSVETHCKIELSKLLSDETKSHRKRIEKKKIVFSGWTRDKFHELSKDLEAIRPQLELPRYSSEKKKFERELDKNTQITKSLREYMESGNKRLEDKELILLMSCYSKQNEYKTTDTIDQKINKIHHVHHWEGEEAALVLWNKSTSQDKKMMRRRIVKESVQALMLTKRTFLKAMKLAVKDKDRKEKAKKDQKVMKKGGEGAASVMARKAREITQQRDEQALNEVFFEKSMTTGGSQSASELSNESEERRQRMALIAYDSRSMSDRLAPSKNPTKNKQETIRELQLGITGIKELNDAFLTCGLLSGVRSFCNTLADFQSMEVVPRKRLK
ncbi:hypothetical protein [Endozoicomonas sp.]|uniref:hypothetical protein n=1 Tax=Endozoicomonas sp. TaxID=1892382 RepID=UPI00383BAF40